MTNPFRGELEVKLNGKTYKTRMTVDACMRVEQACDLSLVKIATRLSEGDLTIHQISSVMTPALRGGGNDVEAKDVAKIIYEAGLAEGLRVCGEVLANVLSGGNQDEEDVDGSTEKNVEGAQPESL